MNPKPLPAPSAADRAAMPNPADQFAWNDAQKLVAHRNMHHLFPTAVVKAAAPLRALPRRDDFLHGDFDVAGYMNAAEVTGLLAIRRGTIVLERYKRGN